MKKDPVPCKYATDYEIGLDKHITWNDSGVCSPCKRNIDRFIARGQAEQRPA